MDIQSIKELIQLVERSNITELQIENGNLRIAIKKGGPGGSAPNTPVAAAPPAVATAPDLPPAGPALHTITSPMVGTYFAAPAPEEPPFVTVGSLVREGQIICIIEAMKLMNEIEADRAGRVREILIQNAKPVEYGQPLIVLEPIA